MKNSVEKKINPWGARVIVRRKTEDAVGSIILPDQCKTLNCEGTIEQVGDECSEKVKVGLHVVYGYYAGSTIKGWADQNIIILNEEDILGTI